MLKRILRSAAMQGAIARILGLYLGLALRTTRWQLEADPESWPHLTGADGRTAIVAFWHDTLPLVPVLWWRARRVNPALRLQVLISRNRDGRMIGDIVRRWDMQVVAGSSDKGGKDGGGRTDKGGAAALRSLLGLLRDRQLVAITPDGPRGPARTAQPGVALLAALSGVPVVPVAACCWPERRLGSWDRMLFPLPFGRGRLVCGAPVFVARGDVDTALPAIGAAIDAAAARAGARTAS